MIRLAVLLVALALITGCGPGQGTHNPTAPLTTIQNYTRMEERAAYPDGEVRLVKVLYTANGTYILDYPVGFIGPIPDGHLREDGTPAFSSLNLGDPDISNLKTLGDPTADDAKGDGDGTVVVK
jgi:hypothetical protein